MAYQDYNWQCADLPYPYRLAELYVTLLLGYGWGIALWSALAYFFEPAGPWPAVALVALMYLGMGLALPERRDP